MKRRSLLTGSISDCLGPSPSKKVKDEEKSNISSSLEFLKSLFPTQVFEGLPVVVLKHQLYSLHENRTTVDRHIADLRDHGELRVLKLGVADEDVCLLDSHNYTHHLQASLGESALGSKVTELLLPSCQDVSVSKDRLMELKFSSDDISTLVVRGVLLVRDVGSWWFGVPRISPFIRSLTKGRSMLRQIIGRSKFKEMLHKDLMSRKLPVSKLPIEYHIHDLIGADIVDRVETTSGALLRLIETTGPQR